MSKRIKKTCSQGHTYLKISDCPVCPKCEAVEMEAACSGLPKIGAPATRALARLGITKLSQLTSHSEAELIALHGFGPKALKILKDELSSRGMSLKEQL